MTNKAGLAELLRGTGVVLLVASLSIFLFQNWSGAGDLVRYFLLLAQAGILIGLGWALRRQWADHKGAMLLAGIGLVTVGANFGVLGAFTWSHFPLWGPPAQDPARLTWEASSTLALAGTVAVALPVLSALTHLAFGLLTTTTRGPLTGLFLAGGLVLLAPVREAWVLCLAAAALAGMAGLLLRRNEFPRSEEKQGQWAMGITLLPPLVILGRGGWLYPEPGSSLYLATLFLLLWLGTRLLARGHVHRPRSGAWLDRAGAVAAVGGGLYWAMFFDEWLFRPLYPWSGTTIPYVLALFAVIAGLLTADIAYRAWQNPHRYRLLAALWAAVPTALAAGRGEEPIIDLLTVAVGGVIGLGAYTYRSWLLGALALLAGGSGAYYWVKAVWHGWQLNAWALLVLIGIGAMLAAAGLERSRNKRAHPEGEEPRP